MFRVRAAGRCMAPSDWLDVATESVKVHGAIQKPNELAALLDILADVKPERIVEIGSDEGGTLYSWSQLPGPPKVIAVDLPSGPYRKASGLPETHGAELVIGDSRRVETFQRAGRCSAVSWRMCCSSTATTPMSVFCPISRGGGRWSAPAGWSCFTTL